jgi:hypothetical protein
MPIRQLLVQSTFDSVEVAIITAAYDEVLRRLDIVRGTNPECEQMIAYKTLAAAQSGEIEVERIVAEVTSQNK